MLLQINSLSKEWKNVFVLLPKRMSRICMWQRKINNSTCAPLQNFGNSPLTLRSVGLDQDY